MRTPDLFDLLLTVESHGWYDLAPWSWDRQARRLGRPLRLSTGRVVHAEVVEVEGAAAGSGTPERTGPAASTAAAPPAAPRRLSFRALAKGRLSAAEAHEAREAMAACLALDEELAPFRERAAALEAERAAGRGRDLPDLRWALGRGAGRLLRSPTVFEDAVKTLCTTNCTWAVTRGMVARLCERLGEPAPLGGRTFPAIEAMAARDERFYREVIRAGYRAPFLRALARGAADGSLDLERLRTAAGRAAPTAEVARDLRALAGFGPYATEHLLRLLGRHGHLALDAWNRKKLARLRGKRRPPSDRTLARWYARYGEWAGLAMWLEVTADWHGDVPTWP